MPQPVLMKTADELEQEARATVDHWRMLAGRKAFVAGLVSGSLLSLLVVRKLAKLAIIGAGAAAIYLAYNLMERESA